MSINAKHIIAAGTLALVGVTGVVISGTNSSGHLHATAIGATDPNATVAKVCTSGYTATIRPPASYTTSLKIKQLKALGYQDQKTADYEEDHLIPLEIGGNPTDPNNLWPELWSDAHIKDKEENQLHADVCSGKLTLKQAQTKILNDWK